MNMKKNEKRMSDLNKSLNVVAGVLNDSIQVRKEQDDTFTVMQRGAVIDTVMARNVKQDELNKVVIQCQCNILNELYFQHLIDSGIFTIRKPAE